MYNARSRIGIELYHLHCIQGCWTKIALSESSYLKTCNKNKYVKKSSQEFKSIEQLQNNNGRDAISFVNLS